jgi:hypothetical protein
MILLLCSPLRGWEFRVKGGAHLHPIDTQRNSYPASLSYSLFIRQVRFALRDAELFTPCNSLWCLGHNQPPLPRSRSHTSVIHPEA